MTTQIFYILQPSVNNGSQWTLLADSNPNMMRGLINELILYDTHWTILGPRFEDCEDVKDLKSLFPDWNAEAWAVNKKQLTYVEREGPIDANLFRYYWTPELSGALASWLESTEGDQRVIWSNIPELTGNILQEIKPVKGSNVQDCVLINSCYFLDSPIHPKTGVSRPMVDQAINWHRQVEGAFRADIAGFCCDGNRYQFFEGLRSTHADYIVEEITKKSAVFRFGYSESELDSIANSAECKQIRKRIRDFVGERKLVVFPNRITNPDYTNGHVFLKAMRQLNEHDYVFYATNPGEKYITQKELEDLDENYLRLKHGTLSRVEYVAVLAEADMHASLFVEEANGGCACREAMHLGSLPIMPYANEYTRLTGADYPGYIPYEGTTVSADELSYAVTKVKDFEFDDFEFRHHVGSFRESSKEVIRELALVGVKLKLLK